MRPATRIINIIQSADSVPAPAKTVDPSIDDLTPVVNQLLTGSDGTWDNATSFARQWYRDGVAIGSATDATYTTVDADFGTLLTYGVTATGPGGTSAEAVSAATAAVGTNMALWFDASDASTLFQDSAGTTPATANNDVVGRWADKSGNARHATQGTTANKPTLKTNIQNGLPGLYFDGGDRLLLAAALDLAVPSIFMVCSLDTGAAGSHALFEFKQGTLFARLSSNANFGFFDAAAYRSSSFALNNTATIATLIAAAANDLDFYKNGGAAVNVATGSAFGARTASQIGANAGAASFHLGHIYEMIMLSVEPSAGLRTAIRDYLNAKWSIY
jgi:hypothetical protein